MVRCRPGPRTDAKTWISPNKSHDFSLVGSDRRHSLGVATSQYHSNSHRVHRSNWKTKGEIPRETVKSKRSLLPPWQGPTTCCHGNPGKIGWAWMDSPTPPSVFARHCTNRLPFVFVANSLSKRNFTDEIELKLYFQVFFGSKSPDFYSSGIPKLPLEWQEVINNNGSYVYKK